MNQYAIHTSSFSTRDEMRSSVPVPMSERRDSVVCPKPRRLGGLNAAVNDFPLRSLRWHLSCQAEICDSKAAGTDFLDIILTKGGYGVEQSYTQVASSPPFLCGSPPSRVANPLIQDERFGDEELSPVSPLMHMPNLPASGLSSSPTSSSRKAGCVRANFGNKPAVRVEGFDCLDRDSRNCSIPALA